MWKLKQYNKITGFTLIEMLVSVALFSVVLMVTLGTIMTIADSNKKARSLMSVTNNLNFAVDSMVRSFKSGELPSIGSEFVYGLEKIAPASNHCFTTKEADYGNGGAVPREVTYCGNKDSNGIGRIWKRIESGDFVELTSPDVDVKYLEFQVSGVDPFDQPVLTIIIEGTVKVSEQISSQFSIQTSVSQLKLNI